MDLVLRGRGVRITERVRRAAERKLARLERMEPKVNRLELEIISEKNPRLRGTHRVEAAFDTPRRTFRARGDAADVESALDVVVEKLERQIRDHREKKRTRLISGAGRVKSAQAAPEKAERQPEE